MKKMESTLTNMIVVLVGVALVTGCLLAVVNHITEGPKAAQKTLALAEGIRTVMGNSDVTVSKTDTVWQADGTDSASCGWRRCCRGEPDDGIWR